jgi:hypothetical protein
MSVTTVTGGRESGCAKRRNTPSPQVSSARGARGTWAPAKQAVLAHRPGQLCLDNAFALIEGHLACDRRQDGSPVAEERKLRTAIRDAIIWGRWLRLLSCPILPHPRLQSRRHVCFVIPVEQLLTQAYYFCPWFYSRRQVPGQQPTGFCITSPPQVLIPPQAS